MGLLNSEANQALQNEWVTFPGGELEGRRPKTLCGPCRLRRAAGAPARAICFECYRADRRRDGAIKAAGEFESSPEGTVARFHDGLPFEPVNLPRLEHLKAMRAHARRQARVGAGQYVDKRRQAQIAARHALTRLGDAMRAQAMHAAELQLPESWLPFVASR
jgi:hypothetical protein